MKLSPDIEKALKALNRNANDILREVLGIRTDGFTTADGTFFPEGTLFLAWYKNMIYTAEAKGGALTIDGKKCASLSAAAAQVTGHATTNGWVFWLVRLPGKSQVRPAIELRKAA